MPKANTKVRHPITGCRVESIFGIWIIEPGPFTAYVNHALSIDLNDLVTFNRKVEAPSSLPESGDPPKPYQMIGDIAVIEIMGPTTKYETSYSKLMGGTSTLKLIQTARKAELDPAVKAIMIREETPGGNVAGAFEWADDIKRINAIKPIRVHIDDIGTSGGMLTASQSDYITANQTALVGSVGVKSWLYDTSKKYEKEGIKVIPIDDGDLKSIGGEGSVISADQIKHMRGLIKDTGDIFVKYVSEGRKLTPEHIRGFRGATMIASKGKEAGLIDEIMSFEESIKRFQDSVSRGYQYSGKKSTTKTVGTPPTRRTSMLTAAQLQIARALPGGDKITEENADTTLLGIVQNMQASASQVETDFNKQIAELKGKVSSVIDPKIATGHINLFIREIAASGKEGKLLPPQEELLKAVVMKDNTPQVSAVNAEGMIMLPHETVMKLIEANKPSGVLKELSGAQPAVRSEPGTPTPADQKVSEERAKELLGYAGGKVQVTT